MAQPASLRRYIVCEQMHQQGTELWCLDCQEVSDPATNFGLVASVDLQAAGLQELVDHATLHESRHHR